MADDTAKLIAIVEANTKQFENALKRIEKTVNNTFKGGAATVTRFEQATAKAAVTTAKLDTALMKTKATASGFASALALPFTSLGAALVTKKVIDYADAWNIATNKLAAATEISGRQARSLEEVNKIASETRSGLVATVDLYSKLLRATGTLAATEEQVAQATETVNKAFKAGGAAASEQAAGILQLSQGLASGILQGDELRSIRENAPVIAAAIAKEFDTTIGGLKALGAAGELTAGRIFKAILAAQKEVDKAFGSTEVTVADAVTKLENSFIQFIGNLDDTTGATSGLVVQLQLAADGFDRLGAAAKAAGSDKTFGELTQQVIGFLFDLDQGVERMKTVRGETDKVDQSFKALMDQLLSTAAILKSWGVDADVQRDFQDVITALGDKTPDAAREAKKQLEELLAVRPQFKRFAAEIQPLIDAFIELADEAETAKNEITKAFALGAQTDNVNDRIRQQAGERAEVLTEMNASAAQREFDRKLEQRTDEIVDAFHKLGQTINRAAAEGIALGQLSRSAPAVGAEGTIDSALDRIIQAEAPKGGPNLAGASTAFGIGQFIESTWLDLFRRHFPDQAAGMSRETILLMRDNNETSKVLIKKYMEENAAVLQRAGLAVTESAIHLSHFLGSGDAVKVLQAAPGTPLAGLIDPDSIAANPRELGGGKTVDDAIAFANSRAALPSSAEAKTAADKAADALEEQRRKTEDLTKAKDDFDKMLKREGESIDLEISSMGKSTAEAEYAAVKQDLLNQLTDAGITLTDEYAAAIENIALAKAALVAKDEIIATNEKKTQEAMQATIERADELRDLASDVLGGLASDLANGVKPAEALANALGKIAQKLIDIGVNAIVSGLFGPQGSSLGGLLFGGGTAATVTAPLATGGLFHQGGVVGAGGPFRMVPASSFVGAPRYHSGGVAGFRPGELPAILQKGEIVIPKLMARGSGGQQRVNVHNTVEVNTSPLLVATMQSLAQQAENNAVHRAPAHIANQQSRRLSGGTARG